MTADAPSLSTHVTSAARSSPRLPDALVAIGETIRHGTKITTAEVEALERALTQPAKPLAVHGRILTPEQVTYRRRAIARVAAACERGRLEQGRSPERRGRGDCPWPRCIAQPGHPNGHVVADTRLDGSPW